MANIIRIKRSATAGAIPSTSALQLGELAVNTYDGRLFMKMNNGADAIAEFARTNQTMYIGTTAVNINRASGALVLTGITSIDGSAATLSATLVETKGGTGQSTYVAGDLLYSDASNSLGKLAIGTAGKLLRSTGSAPAWSTTTLADTFAINSIPYASAANALTALAPANNSVLTSSSSGVPTWGQVDPTLHLQGEVYKRAVVVATTADLAQASFSAGVLTGQATTVAQSATTTAGSTTVTTTASTLKVGAKVSVATTAIPANLTVATLVNATTITLNAASLVLNTTAASGTGSTVTLTFAAQTYAPFAVGTSIVVAGITPTAYNGTFTVTACTTTTVSYAHTATGAQTVAGTITKTISAGTTTPTFAQTIAALAVDGYTLALNDRVLVKDQDNIAENGIYYLSTLGSTSVPWVLTRVVDANTSAKLAGAIVSVDRGTASAGKLFSTTFAVTGTINTNNVYWKQLVDINGGYWYSIPTTARGVNLDLPTRTTSFATGDVTDLAINSFGIETIKAAGASTYTRASTVYIAGAPVASTNATITTPYSLYVADGASYFGSDVLASRVLTTQLCTSNGTELVLSAGEAGGRATSQTGELVYINAEGGLQVNSSPDNWVGGWAARNTATICNPYGDSYFPGLVSAASLEVSSTTKVTNLNADTVDGHHAAAGTYTPFFYYGTDTSANTGLSGRYSRLGNTVTYSGIFQPTIQSAGAVMYRIDIPVASNFAGSANAAGTAAGANGEVGRIVSRSDDTLQLDLFVPTGAYTFPATPVISFHVTYQVI